MRITFCQIPPSEADPERLQHLRRSSLWQQLALKAIFENICSTEFVFRRLGPSLIKYYFIITI